MLLALASQEEIRHQLIIFLLALASEFLLFSIHSSCEIQDVKFVQNELALKSVFDWRASLECVFNNES